MFRKIVKAIIPHNLFKAIEPYGHWAEAILANLYYGFPARGMIVIGVTGTNGKSTTARLIHTMLDSSGFKVGIISTVTSGFGDQLTVNPVHMTTDRSFRLFKRIKQLKRQGAKYLVLEITSHALAQHRAWGVPWSVAVMTNITHEHLDYHGTFERYRDAKLRLFKMANRNYAGLRAGVVNADDPSAQIFCAAVKQCVTYGIKAGDVRAVEIEASPVGNKIKVQASWEGVQAKYSLDCHLPGRFNVYNALAATAVGEVVGLSAESLERGIAALKAVEGRMNSVDEGQNFAVIVDYAHTPDSFEQLLSEMSVVTKGKLIVMFGSAGRRDEAKRAVQGEIAGKYADVVVITEEDDRDVDGGEIMNQIATGAEKMGKVRDQDLFLVLNRSEAIQKTIGLAASGDTVMLLGKGHEKTIERSDGEHPWDEAGEARKAIKSRLQVA